jgi:hypothetical protein
MQRYPLRFLVNRACDDDAGDEARPRRPTTRVNPRAPAEGLRSNVSHEARPGGRPLSGTACCRDAPTAENHEPEVHFAF